MAFELEVTRFTPDPTTELLPVASPAHLDSIVSEYANEREIVFGLSGGEGVGGAFYLFVHGDRAWIHLGFT